MDIIDPKSSSVPSPVKMEKSKDQDLIGSSLWKDKYSLSSEKWWSRRRKDEAMNNSKAIVIFETESLSKVSSTVKNDSKSKISSEDFAVPLPSPSLDTTIWSDFDQFEEEKVQPPPPVKKLTWIIDYCEPKTKFRGIYCQNDHLVCRNWVGYYHFLLVNESS